MADEVKEKLKPLTCRETIQIMCKHSKRNVDVALSKIESHILDDIWIELHPSTISHVVTITGVKILTLISCGKFTYNIYFDGSKIPQLSHLKSPTRYWYFNKKGVLKGIYFTPRWTSLHKHFPKSVPESSSLNEALALYPDIVQKLEGFPDCKPCNHIELERVFQACNINNVLVNYVTSWKRPVAYIPWVSFVKGNDTNLLLVYAYTHKIDGEVQYAMFQNLFCQKPSLVKMKSLQGSPSNPIFNTYSEHYMTSQNNRRSSISLMENGLNLALRLGVISQHEFIHQSYWQAAFHGFLFCEFLNCFTISAIGYVDFETCKIIPIGCNRDWKDLFSFLKERAKRICEVKLETLALILKRLQRDGMNSIGSKHKQCYQELTTYCKKAKFYTYDSDDRLLHLLKIPMANYLCETEGKKFTSIGLKVTRDNSLFELVYKHLSISNVGSILGLEANTNHNGDLSTFRKGMADWNPCYSPQQEEEQTCEKGECIEDARHLFNCYQNFSHHFLMAFNLDINTIKFISLPTLSNVIFWHAYLKLSPNGFLVHPVEKSLPAIDNQLRNHCHGGYTFSAKTEIRVNHPLNGYVPNEERAPKKGAFEIAKSIYSLDLTASYGFAAACASSPGGFGSTWKFGTRQENSQRYRFFEFRAVFYTIYKWQQQQYRNSPHKLIATYHNYSPLGLYWVGKYPIDLVGIFEDGSMEMVQMDGAYCHGCPNPTCPDLINYVDGKSRQECEEKTLQRNSEIWEWIAERQDKIHFYTISDCCNQEYSNSALKHYFQTIPELAQLVSGYNKIDGSLDNLDQDLTFVAVADITCAPLNQSNQENDFDGPIFIDSKEMSWSGKLLLTKDYYTYLKRNFSVKVNYLELVIFYKVDKVIPLVYKYLLQQRTLHSDAINKFYKSVINMSCGFFGCDPSKKIIRSIRLTNRHPRKFSYLTHKFQLEDVMFSNAINDPTYIYPREMTYHTNLYDVHVFQTYVSQEARANPKPSLQSLPIFATIIEFGKLRLNQIFYFYSLSIPRHLYRIVYAHIDSTVLVVARDTLEEAAYNPTQFKATWLKKFFSTNKKPGYLHTEFHYDSSTSWKFISPSVCTWTLAKEKNNKEDDLIFKMPGIPKTSNAHMYDLHTQYLHTGKMTIPAQRRVKKIAGTNTVYLEYQYGK